MAEKFLERWASTSVKSFKDKIRQAAKEIDETNTAIEVLSIRWGIPTLILESIIHLDSLSDASLKLLSENPPPSSTWFLLSEKEELEISQIISNGDICWHNLAKNYETSEISAITSQDIKPETILYFSKKAKKYDVLRPRDRAALHSMGTYLKNNGALSIRQTSYLVNLLKKIQDHNLMEIKISESDTEECLEAQQLINKIL